MENDLISEFISLTGSNINEAQTLLETTNYNLELAVNLFWECSGNISSNMYFFFFLFVLLFFYSFLYFRKNFENNFNENSYSKLFDNISGNDDEDIEDIEEEEEEVRPPIPSKTQQLLPDNLPMTYFVGKGFFIKLFYYYLLFLFVLLCYYCRIKT